MYTGSPSHLDLCVADPSASIVFYDVLLPALGYTRWRIDDPAWHGPNPVRAAWGLRYPDGGSFAVDLRPSSGAHAQARFDTCSPGPHHFAFNASNRGIVDRVYTALLAVGADILDPPFDYGGQPGYGDNYYALFVADPDHLRIEVTCTPALPA